MAPHAPALSDGLHARPLLVAEPSRAVVLDHPAEAPAGAELREPHRPQASDRSLRCRMERHPSSVQVDSGFVRQDPGEAREARARGGVAGSCIEISAALYLA